MMRRTVLAWPVGMALILAACSSSPEPTSPLEITVDAIGLRYEPATIEVTAGQPVRLVFSNKDAMDHDLSIMEFPMDAMGPTAEPAAGHDMSHVAAQPELHVAAMMNQSSILEFTPTQPGTYEFFCTVSAHKEAGMKGTLVVKAP